jgi:hypothetical protein
MKIIAETVESFKELDDIVRKLPSEISSQIETIEFTILNSITCRIKTQFTSLKVVRLPSSTKSILHSETSKEIRILFEFNDSQFIFVLEDNFYNSKINYHFIDIVN